jgi:hypothetical protein
MIGSSAQEKESSVDIEGKRTNRTVLSCIPTIPWEAGGVQVDRMFEYGTSIALNECSTLLFYMYYIQNEQIAKPAINIGLQRYRTCSTCKLVRGTWLPIALQGQDREKS